MKYRIWLVASAASFLMFSCGGNVRSEKEILGRQIEQRVETIKQADTNVLLWKTHEEFRVMLLTHRLPSFSNISSNYLTALSNEYASQILINWGVDKDGTYETLRQKAAEIYLSLTNQFPLEAPYLYLRAGACYLKSGETDLASRWLSKSFLENGRFPELYYYKSLIAGFSRKDWGAALAYYRHTDASKLWIGKEEWLAYGGLLRFMNGDTNAAIGMFESAARENPSRLYRNWDLLPYYIAAGDSNQTQKFLSNSALHLSDPKTGNPRKSQEQSLLANRSLGMDTFIYDFELPGHFEGNSNLLFYNRPLPSIYRSKSSHVVMPFQERIPSRKTVSFVPVFEDYAETPGGSLVFLVETSFDIKKIPPRHKRVAPLSRSFSSNQMLLLVTSTNSVNITTNAYLPTNAKNYLVSTPSNILYITNWNYTPLYIGPVAGKGSSWDYILIGFNLSNQVQVSLFNPETRKLTDYPPFVLQTGDARIVLQENPAGGSPELYLLDRNAVKLSPLAEKAR